MAGKGTGRGGSGAGGWRAGSAVHRAAEGRLPQNAGRAAETGNERAGPAGEVPARLLAGAVRPAEEAVHAPAGPTDAGAAAEVPAQVVEAQEMVLTQQYNEQKMNL